MCFRSSRLKLTHSEIMFFYLLILFCPFVIIEARHFNGGTINWAPIDPYTNASSVGVTITQSYSWAYPMIKCANNVPITTTGRSTQNWNLTCVVDCTTDGGYSTKPIDLLTDCTSSSSTLAMMNSERSHNLTLTAGSHFYLANEGSAWVALNDPAQNNLQWSIVTFIDLRMRPDGFINTPPVVSVASPQYAIVNKTIQINIPVSDVNAGDDVRCRWATYTPGYRRRRSDDEEHVNYQSNLHFYEQVPIREEIIHTRKKRISCGCSNTANCGQSWCECACAACSGNSNCGTTTAATTTTTKTTSTTTSTKTTSTTSTTTTTSTRTTSTTSKTTSTTSTTTTTVTTSITDTTTIDTPGTLKSTSTYPQRQAIDECGGICYLNSTPNGTTLSDCTITFTGYKVGIWYAVAIQVKQHFFPVQNILFISSRSEPFDKT